MIAYVVTAGEYSDYHICRVYLNKKDAKRFIFLSCGKGEDEFDGMRIEEWEIGDNGSFLSSNHVYLCRYYLQSGEYDTIHVSMNPSEEDIHRMRWASAEYFPMEYNEAYRNIALYIWASDPIEARKIFNERIGPVLAKQKPVYCNTRFLSGDKNQLIWGIVANGHFHPLNEEDQHQLSNG